MLDFLRKIGYFLCIIDETPQLNLPDIAFVVILGKIIFATQLDWQAIVVLAVTILNSMHSRQTPVTSDVKELTDKLARLEEKVIPIVDKLKGMSA